MACAFIQKLQYISPKNVYFEFLHILIFTEGQIKSELI